MDLRDISSMILLRLIIVGALMSVLNLGFKFPSKGTKKKKLFLSYVVIMKLMIEERAKCDIPYDSLSNMLSVSKIIARVSIVKIRL